MARVGDAIAQQRERISSLSSVIRDHRMAMGSASRRDRLLGVNSPSQLDGQGSGGEFKEEDVWGMMLPAAKPDDGPGLPDKDRHPQLMSNLIGSPSSSSSKASPSLSKRHLAPDHTAVGLSSIARGGPGSSTSAAAASSSSSGGGGRVTSSSRMIPQKVAAAGGGGGTAAVAMQQHQSAPVNVPDWSRILGSSKSKDHRSPRNFGEFGGDGEDGGEDGGDDEWLPPHELVARSQATTFSVFEGAGRTLKGRDLSRVRNAVLKQTGFL